MGEKFDPYYKWLGIPPKDQPPHYYRLLGIEVFEQDREVIDAAANRLMGYLKDLAVGDESAYSQELLNEIARARLCLLNKKKKSAYDEKLRRQLDADRDHKPSAKAPPPRVPRPSAPPPAAPPSVPETGPLAKPFPRVPAAPSSNMLSAGSTGVASPVESEPPDEESPLGIVVKPPAGAAAQRTKQRVPVRTRRYSRSVYAAAALILIVGGIGLVLIIVMSILLLTSDDSKQQTPEDRSSTVNPPVLVFDMSDEERGSVQEFLLNDAPQSLPMKREYVLEEGRHRLILKRRGFHDYFDSPTLVNDQSNVIDPEWVPE